jgi:hypothetical protein
MLASYLNSDLYASNITPIVSLWEVGGVNVADFNIVKNPFAE